jgi:type I restriction enzyme S subunit
LKLTPSTSVSPEFLKYWMDSTDFQDSLKEQSGGAAIQNVASVSVLKGIGVSLPPLHEQQRIVGILDEAFEGIATAKANAEKNLQNAHALFESHLQSVFTQRGEGWVEKRLGDVCDLFQGLCINAQTKHLLVEKSSLPLLRIKDLRENSAEQFVPKMVGPRMRA